LAFGSSNLNMNSDKSAQCMYTHTHSFEYTRCLCQHNKLTIFMIHTEITEIHMYMQMEEHSLHKAHFNAMQWSCRQILNQIFIN